MIQVEGTNRQVHIKVMTQDMLDEIITTAIRTITSAHKEGNISAVKVEMSGLGGRRIRVVNLPPEMPPTNIFRVLEPYGKA
jgi:hypothetical protein